jgi:hypothetical protein
VFQVKTSTVFDAAERKKVKYEQDRKKNEPMT